MQYVQLVKYVVKLLWVYTGAVLIAQWMRPCHCPGATDIAQQLDSIADMVARKLIRQWEEEGNKGDEEEEEGKKGDEGDKKEGGRVKRVKESALAKVVGEGATPVGNILTALNSVLYDQLGFKGAGESYYSLENSFIDHVSGEE